MIVTDFGNAMRFLRAAGAAEPCGTKTAEPGPLDAHRVVIAAPPTPGARLSPGAIRTFLGGAPLPARRLRTPIFEFVPQGECVILMNAPRDPLP